MSEKTMNIRKAVIPVAGLGTRMLPATKAIVNSDNKCNAHGA